MKDHYFNQPYRRTRWWLAAGLGLALFTGPAVSWAATITLTPPASLIEGATTATFTLAPNMATAEEVTFGCTAIDATIGTLTPSSLLANTVDSTSVTVNLTGVIVGSSITCTVAPGVGGLDTITPSDTFTLDAVAAPPPAADLQLDWDDDSTINPADDTLDTTTPAATLIVATPVGTNVTCDGFTDIEFGLTPLGKPVSRYFRISNPDSAAIAPGTTFGAADAAILLPGLPTVPAGFEIVGFDGATILPNTSGAVFEIKLTAATSGSYGYGGNGEVTFSFSNSGVAGGSSACFEIGGVVDIATAPVIGGEIMLEDITDPAAIVEMVDGTTPYADFGTELAPIPQGTPVTKKFRITNVDAVIALNLSGIAFSNNECTITSPLPNQNLAALGTVEFDVQFKATNAGTLDPVTGLVQPVLCEMIIANSDTDEGPFNTILRGYVAPVSTPVVNADIKVQEETTTGLEVFDGVAPTTPFPMTFAGTLVSRNFVITNIGTANLDLNALGIGGVNAASFSWEPVTNPFPDFLAPNASATFKVNFIPTAVGSYNAYLQIFNNAILTNENPFDILLSGTAMSATKEIEVFDGTVNLVKGSTVNLTTAPGGVVGTPITKTFTIQNIGGTVLKVDSLQFSAGGTGLKLSSLAATTLDAAGGAKDKIEFTVTLEAATAGEFTGTVSIANDDTDENPFTFIVTGTILSSLTSPEVTVWEVLNDGSLDEIFDEQTEKVDFSAAINTPVTKTFKVKNIGGVALDLTALSPLPKGFSLVGVFPTEVLPGETVEFKVKLDTSAVATYGGTLEFFSTDIDENPFSFPIGASVDVPSPEIEVLDGTTSVANGTAVAVAFGPTGIGSSVSKIFTVKNTGEADLNLTSLVTFKEGGAGFTLNSFNPGPVAKGGFTSFTVTLNASTAGTYTGTVTFGNDDKDENPYTFPVSGTVDNTPPTTEEIEVWDGSPADIIAGTAIQIPDGDTNKVDFGITPIGVPSIQTFTVKNLGSEVLTLYSLRLPVGYELQKGVTLSTVAPQQQVSFDVILNPTANGTYAGSLELFNSDVDETPYDFPLTGIVGTETPVDVATLTVSRNGEGLVSSADQQINCGTNAAQCEYTYTLGTAVTLTATPDAGSQFKDWTGGCTGTDNPTTVTLSAATTCTATFFVPVQQVNLTFTAPQNGTISSDVGGLDCGSTCTATFASGDRVTVTATAASGYVFSTWAGDCSGHGTTNPINLTLTESLDCAATFTSTAPESVTVTVTKPDNGTLSTADGKIDCGNLCSASYNIGETLTLTAVSTSAQFDSWEGDCAGQSNPATLTVGATPISCKAIFKNTPSVEGECFEQGLGILTGGNTCEAATLTTSESSTGSAGTAAMRMGISKFGGIYKQQDTVTLIDPIKTAGAIRVDTADIGQAADIVVIGRHDWDMYPEKLAWYMMVAYPQSPLGWTIGILPFDLATGDPIHSEIQALETVDSLPAYYTVYMYSGNFVYPGPLKIWFGYRLQSSGKVVLSVDPIDVTILPTPTN